MKMQIMLIRTVICCFLLFDVFHAMSIVTFKEKHRVLYERVKELGLTHDDYQSLSEYVNQVTKECDGSMEGFDGRHFQIRYNANDTVSNHQLFYSWVVYKRLLYQNSLEKNKYLYIKLYGNTNDCNSPKGLFFKLNISNGSNGRFLNCLSPYDLWIVKRENFPEFNDLIINFAKTQYTIYINTSLDSFCQALWTVRFLLKENPQLQKGVHLKNIISSVNIHYDDELEQTYLSLSIARLFFPEGKDINSLTADDIKDRRCWDYKKSKHYLELALVFFSLYFSKRTTIKPMIHNQKGVTKFNDLIWFSHGNLDDREVCKKYFEDDGCYLTPKNDENFKVDIESIKKYMPYLNPVIDKLFINEQREKNSNEGQNNNKGSSLPKSSMFPSKKILSSFLVICLFLVIVYNIKPQIICRHT